VDNNGPDLMRGLRGMGTEIGAEALSGGTRAAHFYSGHGFNNISIACN